MNRRGALFAALAAGAWPTAPGVAGQASAASAGRAVPTAAPIESAFVAWSEQAIWFGRPGAGLRRLEAADGVGRALTPAGLWLATAAGRLQRWPLPPVGAGARQPAATLEVAPPVHAVQADMAGAHLLVAHARQLTLLGGRGEVMRVYEGSDLARRRHDSAEALFHLRGRRSFVAAWPALGELWEISLDPHSPPIFDGLVHDYRFGEGLASPGYLGARRAPLGVPMPRFEFAAAEQPWVAGMLDDALVVVHLDVRRRVATLPLAGARPAGSAVLRRSGTEPAAWWVPHGAGVQVIDPRRWVLGARIATPAPVHELCALGSRVIIRAGEGAAARLLACDGRTAASPTSGPAEVDPSFAVGQARAPVAMAVHPTGSSLLVSSAAPGAALQWLDTDGRLLERWPLPEGSVAPRVGWLPPAA
ncbi:MAG: hypothetical protein JNJ89_14385 [Rubrivivax sp.]|nr:hypothetical protein [Rubrivivax sp.]